MKLSSPPTQLQQVQAHPDKDKYALVASYDADNATYAQEHRAAKSGLLDLCPAKMWHNNSYSTFCPRPILITQQHQQRLRDLHSGLGLALTDIVERWWTDAEARFPERMPLEPKEEALLQWIDAQSADVLPAFRERLGAWRPDFLVEKDAAGNENFRITEINARFCFNLMMYTGYGQEVLRGMGVTGAGNGLVGTTDLEHVVNSAMRLFDPQRRLHFVKGNEKGMDIHMFIDFMKRRLGLTPRLITPADLRLVPDPQSKTGFKLCCVAEEKASGPNPSLIASWKGETLEEIDQIGLELQQRELLALSPEMLQQISLQCFNDLRTVLLVHDKRMLGIIRQELPSLVERGVLTPYQADCLDRGIPESMPPGSPELMRFLQLCRASPDLKDAYLLKSVRSGKGDGIFFGDSMTPTEWVSRLEQQRCADLDPSNSSCIVQRKVCHMLYDVVLQESGEKFRYPLVGTYFSTGGEFLSLGVWRSSPDQVVAVFHGGSWACYVTTCD